MPKPHPCTNCGRLHSSTHHLCLKCRKPKRRGRKK